jgi:hypothetical protein
VKQINKGKTPGKRTREEKRKDTSHNGVEGTRERDKKKERTQSPTGVAGTTGD